MLHVFCAWTVHHDISLCSNAIEKKVKLIKYYIHEAKYHIGI